MENIYKFILTFVGAIGFALCFVYIYRIIAFKIGLVDKPNSRKVHTNSIPLVGGIGIFSAVFTILIISLPNLFQFYDIKNLLFGAIVMLIMGVVDDRFEIRASLKLAIQLLLAHYVYYHGISIDSLHGIFGIYSIPVYAQHILTLIIITGVVNAFNLMDGIDGLAASLSIISFLALTLLSIYIGRLELAIIFISFIGALLGFLVFNFSKSKKTFMGDAGSLVLGFIIVSSSIIILKSAKTPMQVSVIFPSLLGIMLLPVFDSLRVYFRRLKAGKSPFQADKTHLHHLVLQLGIQHKKASFFIILIVFAIISLGILSHSTLGVTIMLIFLSYFYFAITNLLQLNSDINLWKSKISKMEKSEILV